MEHQELLALQELVEQAVLLEQAEQVLDLRVAGQQHSLTLKIKLYITTDLHT
jgi:hypothetical protein